MPKYREGLSASSLSFNAALLMVLFGMGWGIVMAASHDHSAMPAHAHLNLLGWVSLFLFGVFYYLHPVIDRSRLALAQVVVWIVGTVVMVAGVGLIHTGHAIGEPFAGIGSIMALAGMLMFAWMVFRRHTTAAEPYPTRAVAPAE